MEEGTLESTANLTQDDILELIGDFPVQPTRNRLIITVNTIEELGEDGVRLTDKHLDESQYVLAVGSTVHGIKAGNKVLLDLDKLTERQSARQNAYESVGTINLKPVKVNGRIYAMIYDGVVDAIDNR